MKSSLGLPEASTDHSLLLPYKVAGLAVDFSLQERVRRRRHR